MHRSYGPVFFSRLNLIVLSMRPTVEYIEKRFDEFNRMIFGGHLPPVPVRLSDAGSFLGQFVSKARTLPDGTCVNDGCELRISARMDLPQDTVDDTIIHEMIHYFIHYNRLPERAPHGPIFRSIMNGINASYGRNITVSHRCTPAQRSEAISRPAWHVIAVLHFIDHKDRIGIKVLPRNVQRVIDYYRHAIRSSEIGRIELFLHNDPYFNRYPTSAALRYHETTHSDLMPHLTDARMLTIHGNTLAFAK